MGATCCNKVAESHLFLQRADDLNMTGGSTAIGKAKWVVPEDAIKCYTVCKY